MTISIDKLRNDCYLISATGNGESKAGKAALEYLKIREAFGEDVDLLKLAKALKAGQVAVVPVELTDDMLQAFYDGMSGSAFYYDAGGSFIYRFRTMLRRMGWKVKPRDDFEEITWSRDPIISGAIQAAPALPELLESMEVE